MPDTLFFEHHPDPMWVFEVQSLQLLAVNQAALDYFGYTREEFLALRLHDLRPPEEWPALEADLAQGTVADGRRRWSYRLKSGELAFGDIRARNLQFSGRPARLIVLRDVSELVREQQRSQALSQRLEETLESITDAFFVLDRAWCFTYLNSQAEVLLARSRQELLGCNVWQEFPAAVGTSFQACYTRAMSLGETQRFTEFYPPLNVWFQVSAYPSVEGLAVYFRDVTQELANQHQLRLLQAAVGQQTDMLMITEAVPSHGPEGPRIVYVNQAFTRVTGYTAPEVLGRTPHFLQGPETSAAVRARLRAALQAGAPVRAEIVNYKRDGTPFWLELDIAPLANEQGQLTHWVAVQRDISARKALQSRAAESEERLRQAQRLEAVGQLTGGVAHDFNNLLTVILGNAELMIEAAEQPALQQLARMTLAAAERGAELTSRLLAFARRQPLQPRVADLKQLVGSMESLLRRTLPESVQLAFRSHPGLWLSEVDPGQFETAVLNLVINARDAMPQGGRLELQLANTVLEGTLPGAEGEVTPGPYVQLSVSDTGAGMAPEVVKRAFDPFFTTKAVGKGSGLGLSMVYGFVRQSGGHARIDSEAGSGTTITLYFPRAWAQEALMETPHPEVTEGGAEHILVVEDDSLVRQNLIAQLRGLGYRVTSAASAAQALQVLQSTPDVQLLFTDVIMPGGMNGAQLVAQALQLQPGLKVLYTSGYTENAISHQGRLDSGVHLLSKPYRRQEMALKVRQVLDGP